jgi:2'-5' RNA ligase
MRYFFGFDLNPSCKLSLDHWRDKALPAVGKAVPAGNFHITSLFLGQVEPAVMEQLVMHLDNQAFPSVALQLNQLGYFAKPKVLWLGCEDIPQSLIQIHEQLLTLANQHGLNLPKSRYIPHVTLFRKVLHNPPSAVLPIDLHCEFDQLHLFESVSTDSGVRYPIRYSWKIGTPSHYRPS